MQPATPASLYSRMFDNEIVLNSEEAPLKNATSEANTTDSLIVDNAVEASNASVDLNSTPLYTAE